MSNVCEHGRYDKGYCSDCQVDILTKECDKYRSAIKVACEVLRSIDERDNDGWPALNAHDRATLLELEAMVDK
jgi:hypothetical protein